MQSWRHSLTAYGRKWQANAGSEWLRARFEEDRGAAIVARLAHLTRNHVFNAREWTGRPR